MKGKSLPETYLKLYCGRPMSKEASTAAAAVAETIVLCAQESPGDWPLLGGTAGHIVPVKEIQLLVPSSFLAARETNPAAQISSSASPPACGD